MIVFQHTIQDPNGIHARTAAGILKEAAKYESKIMMTRGGMTVEASDVIGLMGLRANCGQMVEVRVEGPDEKEAEAGLKAYMAEHV